MTSPPLKYGVGGILYSGLSVREWMRQSVCPVNPVNIISQKPMKGTSPKFGHRCFWVHRYANKLWGQKVKRSKVTADNDPKPREHHISETNKRILVTDVCRFIDMPIRFWDQKVKGQGHNRHAGSMLPTIGSSMNQRNENSSLDKRDLDLHVVSYFYI